LFYKVFDVGQEVFLRAGFLAFGFSGGASSSAISGAPADLRKRFMSFLMVARA
jgi:hypothetical protein